MEGSFWCSKERY